MFVAEHHYNYLPACSGYAFRCPKSSIYLSIQKKLIITEAHKKVIHDNPGLVGRGNDQPNSRLRWLHESHFIYTWP